MSIAVSGEWSSIVATALVSLLGFLIASLVRSKLREADLQARFLESSKNEATDLAEKERKKAEEQAEVILQRDRRLGELQDRIAALKDAADEAAIHKANRQDLLAQLAKAEKDVQEWGAKAGRNREESLKFERELVKAQAENRVLFENNQTKQTLLKEMEKRRKAEQEEAKEDTLRALNLVDRVRAEHAKEIANLRETIKDLRGRLDAAWQGQGQESGLREEMRRIWGD